MVTIIHLPEAPNPKVGPPTLHQPRTYTVIVSFVLYNIFCSILTRGGEGVRNRILGEYQKGEFKVEKGNWIFLDKDFWTPPKK